VAQIVAEAIRHVYDYPTTFAAVLAPKRRHLRSAKGSPSGAAGLAARPRRRRCHRRVDDRRCETFARAAAVPGAREASRPLRPESGGAPMCAAHSSPERTSHRSSILCAALPMPSKRSRTTDQGHTSMPTRCEGWPTKREVCAGTTTEGDRAPPLGEDSRGIRPPKFGCGPALLRSPSG
jgi:hypothetical protein